MPVTTQTPEQRRQMTLPARRRCRFVRARRRIEQIVAGEPKLTPAEFAELRALLDKK